jgi:hypothetical protein
MRTFGNETIYCAFNMSAERVRCEIKTDRELHLMNGHGFNSELDNCALEIPPYGAAYVQLG